MNTFDSLRLDFQSILIESQKYEIDEVEDILSKFMLAMQNYDVIEKQKDIIVYNVVPESVNKYLAVLKLEGRTDGTIYNYMKVLTSFFAFVKKKPEEITHRDIWSFLLDYQNNRAKPVSNRTMEQYRGYIKYYFDWMQDVGYMSTNPTRGMSPIKYEKKQRKSMTRHDLILLSEACKNEKERAVIEFMYSTGCRINEAVNIKISDIDWNNKSVRVIRKGNKEGILYFGDRAEIAMKKYLDSRHDTCEYLFVSARGHHQINTGSLRENIHKIYLRAGVENISVPVTPHIIRHTTATLAVQAGMPVEYVQQMLGHEQINTTMQYVDIANSNVRNACTKYVV